MDNGRVIQLSSDNGGVNADSDPCNMFDPLILLRAEKVTFCYCRGNAKLGRPGHIWFKRFPQFSHALHKCYAHR